MEAPAPRPGERGRGGLAGSILVAALVIAIAIPASAGAWKYVFNDFFAVQGQGIGTAFAVAKKCKGGKLGYYDFRSAAGGFGGTDTEFEIVLEAKLPVFAKWKPLKDQTLEINASDDFDPATIAEISSAYGAFFDGIETKWSPGELLFKHPPLVVFGNEILSEGKHLEDFKPKDKC